MYLPGQIFAPSRMLDHRNNHAKKKKTPGKFQTCRLDSNAVGCAECAGSFLLFEYRWILYATPKDEKINTDRSLVARLRAGQVQVQCSVYRRVS